MTIPASSVVSINPAVISGGGSALALNGVILTNNPAIPIGAAQPFPSAASVLSFFGPSVEADMATVYFNGFLGSTKKPGRLYFSQYAAASVAAYVRGGRVSGMTLAQLQALSGTLIVTVDGAVKTSSTINLSAATSFSNAATIIAAGFSSFGATAAYDSVRGAFTITSSTTGASSTIGYCSGSLAAGLKMTAATGAITSQGAIASTPASAMASVVAATLNWAGFTTSFEPLLADKLLFSAWTNASNNRFAYVAWDTDASAATPGNTTALGPQLLALESSGTVPVYGPATLAALVLGIMASIDTEAENGRATFAFRSQSGMSPSISNQDDFDALKANGYNFYGAFATANDANSFLYPGSVTGPYAFLDAYINQVYLNSQLQLALINLLINVKSIPYNDAGYALIAAACMDPINEAINFGSIRGGVPLSEQQKALVNNAAGAQIDSILSSRGWYLQILPPTAQVRAARGTPPINFWYMDGGSVQSISMASIEIQ